VRIDVFTVGEAMLRLSAPQGETLEGASRFDVHVAGSESNVASALAQLGRAVTWVSRVPDSPLGRRIVSSLRAAGVDCSSVLLADTGRLGTYFVDVRPDPLATTVVYDREGSAVCGLTVEDIDWDLVADARVIHLSGITPALSENLATIANELAARAGGADSLLTLDVNYRSKLWSPGEAEQALSGILESADLIVCGRDDVALVFGQEGEPADVARQMSERFSCPAVVVTAGSEGAFWQRGKDSGHVPSREVRIIDPIGAGDAFMAGAIDGLLDDDLPSGVARGEALAALALTTVGDLITVNRAEMTSLMTIEGPDVDR
jgi:2-dehydro-3-deoxygluconokinase